MNWHRRQLAKWRLWRNLGEVINRRAAVENVLFDVADGKRPMLTREECRELALKLVDRPRFRGATDPR